MSEYNNDTYKNTGHEKTPLGGSISDKENMNMKDYEYEAQGRTENTVRETFTDHTQEIPEFEMGITGRTFADQPKRPDEYTQTEPGFTYNNEPNHGTHNVAEGSDMRSETHRSYAPQNETNYTGYGAQTEINYTHQAHRAQTESVYATQAETEVYQGYSTPTKTHTKPRKKSGFAKRAVSVVCAALVFGGVSGSIFYAINAANFDPYEPPAAQTEAQQMTSESSAFEQTTISGAVSEEAFSVADVAANAMPSIVAITNNSVQEVQSMFGRTGQYYEAQSSGSGVIIDQNEEEILIATNNHVIDSSTSLTVAFGNDTVATATVKGTEASEDLAIISVKIADMSDETLDYIKVVAVGDSSELVMGEQVVAIGNALGYGLSVTSGYVSALEREITVDTNTTLTVLQTDTAINPGNSGGALLNMKGELIAINTAKTSATDTEGVGYAIPISHAQEIFTELANRPDAVPESEAGYLGVRAMSVDAETAEMYNIPEGAYLQSVEAGTPAAQAGLQEGDVIIAIDDYEISSSEDLTQTISYYTAGTDVTLTIMRPGEWEYEKLTPTVTLANKPTQTASVPQIQE